MGLLVSTGLSVKASGPLTIKLASPAFGPHQLIPAQYTCHGADRSPPLIWDGPPPATQALVLIVDDPDAPRGTWGHWVVYNLPPYQHQLPEGVPPQPTLPPGSLQGTSDFGQLGYRGPCHGTHRYLFKLYALDTPLGLPPGATKAQVEQAMQGHILATGGLDGRYRRP